MQQQSFSPNQGKFNNARLCILLTVILSVVNIVAVNFDTYFLYSTYISTLLASVGYVMKIESGIELYYIVGAVLAGITLIPYLLAWIFSKKHRGWLIACFIFFIIDTILLLITSLGLLLEGELTSLFDIAIHVIMLIEVGAGIKAASALKEEEKILAEVAKLNAENQLNNVNGELGENGEISNENTVNNELLNKTRKLTIKRASAFNGWAVPFIVYVNGKQVCKLANGKSATIDVPCTTFELGLALSNGFAANKEIVEFGEEYLSYIAKMKMGFTTSVIDIKKV